MRSEPYDKSMRSAQTTIQIKTYFFSRSNTSFDVFTKLTAGLLDTGLCPSTGISLLHSIVRLVADDRMLLMISKV